MSLGRGEMRPRLLSLFRGLSPARGVPSKLRGVPDPPGRLRGVSREGDRLSLGEGEVADRLPCCGVDDDAGEALGGCPDSDDSESIKAREDRSPLKSPSLLFQAESCLDRKRKVPGALSHMALGKKRWGA